MIPQEKMENNEILGGLEKRVFRINLSYYNLLGKGMISAAEIAYCSNLPNKNLFCFKKT